MRDSGTKPCPRVVLAFELRMAASLSILVAKAIFLLFFLVVFFSCHGAKGVGERWAFAAFKENDFSRKGW